MNIIVSTDKYYSDEISKGLVDYLMIGIMLIALVIESALTVEVRIIAMLKHILSARLGCRWTMEIYCKFGYITSLMQFLYKQKRRIYR